MADDDYDDAALVDQAARRYVRSLGRDAPAYLRDQGARARAAGEQRSAAAWDDIAGAAERLL
jgi:hypothetical protein